MTDTIYALSTPVGGAIAVIRISGPDTLCALRAVFNGKTEHRYVAHGSIIAGGRLCPGRRYGGLFSGA